MISKLSSLTNRNSEGDVCLKLASADLAAPIDSMGSRILNVKDVCTNAQLRMSEQDYLSLLPFSGNFIVSHVQSLGIDAKGILGLEYVRALDNVEICKSLYEMMQLIERSHEMRMSKARSPTTFFIRAREVKAVSRLVRLWRQREQRSVHLSEVCKGGVSTPMTTLKDFGLIYRVQNGESGMYVPTELGVKFVDGQVKIPNRVIKKAPTGEIVRDQLSVDKWIWEFFEDKRDWETFMREEV